MIRVLSLLGFVFLLFSITGCSKAKIGPGYTGKMGGVRLWHRSSSWYEYNPITKTRSGGSSNPADTTFALTVVNDTVVRFWSDTYTYNALYSTDSVFYFGDAYYALAYHNGSGIAYFPLTDSISYVYAKYSNSSNYDVVVHTD